MKDMKELLQRRLELAKRGELRVAYNPAQKVANLRESTGKVSPLQAIKAFCWHCMGGTATEWDSDIKKTIRECSAGPESKIPCPLHDYRPYK